MSDMDALFPRVLRYAPNCSDPLLFSSIREATRRVCETGKVWRETYTMPITRPQFEGICAVDEVSIVKIESASLDGNKLEPVSIAFLDDKHPLWDEDENETGPARYITQLTPNSVTIYPKVAGTLKARLILKPSMEATTLPDFLIEQYAEQIGKGAAAQVLMTPDAQVQNVELGAGLEIEFQSWLDRLNVKAAKGQQNARLRTKANFF